MLRIVLDIFVVYLYVWYRVVVVVVDVTGILFLVVVCVVIVIVVVIAVLNYDVKVTFLNICMLDIAVLLVVALNRCISFFSLSKLLSEIVHKVYSSARFSVLIPILEL